MRLFKRLVRGGPSVNCVSIGDVVASSLARGAKEKTGRDIAGKRCSNCTLHSVPLRFLLLCLPFVCLPRRQHGTQKFGGAFEEGPRALQAHGEDGEVGGDGGEDGQVEREGFGLVPAVVKGRMER